MKMYGFKFIYSISINDLKPSVIKNNNFERMMADDGGHSCNCDSGSSGCTKEIKYCRGGIIVLYISPNHFLIFILGIKKGTFFLYLI